jgi:hypothetical protein
MTVPTGATPGDTYAIDITNDLINRVAPHRHTGAANLDGYQLDANSLSITSDINFNSTNANALRSVRFISQTTILSGAQDLNSLYVSNGNVFFNDANGTPIQLTANGTLNVGVFTTTKNFIIKDVTNAPYPITPADIYTAFDVNTTGSASTLTLPTAAAITPTAAGRFYYIKDVGNFAGTNNITIQVNGGSGNTIQNAGATGLPSFVIAENGGSCLIYTDGISLWFVEFFQQYAFNNQTITLTNNSTLLVNTGSAISLTSGFLNLAASQMNVTGASNININDTTEMLFVPTSLLQVNGTFHLGATSVTTGSGAITMATGSTTTFASGSTLTLQGTSSLTGVFNIAGGAINANSFGAILSNTLGGIASTAAGGILSTAVGGIGLAGGPTDWPTFYSGFSTTTRGYSKTYGIPGAGAIDNTLSQSWFDAANGWKQNPGPTTNYVSGVGQMGYSVTPNGNPYTFAIENVHLGAQLASVTIHYVVGGVHGAPPDNKFGVNVGYVPVTGGLLSVPISMSGGSVIITGTDWTNETTSQSSQAINLVPNSMNAGNLYVIQITGESGGTAQGGSVFFAYTVVWNQIPNMAFD